MKDATKRGIAQKCKMDPREQITEDEEAIFLEKGLLGGHSAESLMYTIYFYYLWENFWTSSWGTKVTKAFKHFCSRKPDHF